MKKRKGVGRGPESLVDSHCVHAGFIYQSYREGSCKLRRAKLSPTGLGPWDPAALPEAVTPESGRVLLFSFADVLYAVLAVHAEPCSATVPSQHWAAEKQT